MYLIDDIIYIDAWFSRHKTPKSSQNHIETIEKTFVLEALHVWLDSRIVSHQNGIYIPIPKNHGNKMTQSNDPQ
jgi:hypothetical protein